MDWSIGDCIAARRRIGLRESCATTTIHSGTGDCVRSAREISRHRDGAGSRYYCLSLKWRKIDVKADFVTEAEAVGIAGRAVRVTPVVVLRVLIRGGRTG